MSEAFGKPMVARYRVDNVKGASYMLLAVASFSAMNALAKALVNDYPVHQVVFARCILAFLPLLLLIVARRALASLRTHRWGLHGLRTAISLIALVTTFLALGMMKLADATVLFFTFPLFVALFSKRLLGEAVSRHRMAALVVGFAGILAVANPTGGSPVLGTALALICAVSIALEVIVMRQMSTTESPTAITFYFLLFGSIATGLYALAQGWALPELDDLLAFLALGLCGALAQFFLAKAFRFGEAAVIAPLEFTSIVMAAGIAYFFFHEIPSLELVLGAILIAASGVYLVRSE